MYPGNIVIWIKPLRNGTLGLERKYVDVWPKVGDLAIVIHLTADENVKLDRNGHDLGWIFPSDHLEVIDVCL